MTFKKGKNSKGLSISESTRRKITIRAEYLYMSIMALLVVAYLSGFAIGQQYATQSHPFSEVTVDGQPVYDEANRLFTLKNTKVANPAIAVRGESESLSLVPILGDGSYTSISRKGDSGIIFSAGQANTGGLVIAPWGNQGGGIKISKDGKVGIGVGDPTTDLQIKEQGTISGAGRLHIDGPEWLYILNHHGVIVSKAWGGTGDLKVEGSLNVLGNMNVEEHMVADILKVGDAPQQIYLCPVKGVDGSCNGQLTTMTTCSYLPDAYSSYTNANCQATKFFVS